MNIFCLLVFILFVLSVNLLATEIENFTDQHLDRIQKDKKSALLLTISPHMPLSYLAYQQLLAVAKNHYLDIFLLLDPKTNGEQHHLFVQSMSTTFGKVWHLKSQKLFRQGLHLHYPSVVFINQGQISPRIYPGYKSQDSYDKWLAVEQKLWD